MESGAHGPLKTANHRAVCEALQPSQLSGNRPVFKLSDHSRLMRPPGLRVSKKRNFGVAPGLLVSRHTEKRTLHGLIFVI